MRFIDDIFSFVWDASDFFYDAYLEVKGWVAPFRYLKTPLYALYQVFWDLTTPIAQLGDWADNVAYKVTKILSISDIRAALKTWLDYATWAWDWVSDWWANVADVVTSWWSTASLTVQVWIDDAVHITLAQIDAVRITLAQIASSWDSFKAKIPSIDEVISWWGNWSGNVLTTVNTWWLGTLKDVKGLIDSAFVARQSLWAGWQDMRAKVVEFFQDPLEFLRSRFTDWFLGPEG